MAQSTWEVKVNELATVRQFCSAFWNHWGPTTSSEFTPPTCRGSIYCDLCHHCRCRWLGSNRTIWSSEGAMVQEVFTAQAWYSFPILAKQQERKFASRLDQEAISIPTYIGDEVSRFRLIRETEIICVMVLSWLALVVVVREVKLNGNCLPENIKRVYPFDWLNFLEFWAKIWLFVLDRGVRISAKSIVFE